MKGIRKALTFRASSIGDCLMGKYLLENIHAQFPDARLGIVVASRGAMIRDLLAAYPWIEVIEANRRSPGALFSFLKDFYGSDLVVTQYAGKHGGSFGLASKFVARLLAKRGSLIGFKDVSKWNTALYDHLLPVRSGEAVAEHERETLRAAGLSVALPFPKLECVRSEAALSKFGLETGKYMLVHFFAGNTGRSLSPEKSREIISALHASLPDMQLVITGGVGDKESALAIAHGLPATVIAGDASLQEMMNLISQSACVVSVDTGMAHMAAQLGKQLVVLRTCLGPNWWFVEQYGKDAPITVLSCDTACATGHRTTNGYADCINGISVGEVVSHVA
ncbi:MAG: glycosyltransferase family 9 protein [Candidatus Paceibacterota bacterium]|jgi:ADP-heptose:LPS heptosyltransferase